MKDNVFYDVIIVGAGVSGLMCALQCKRRGKSVLLLEKQPQPGRKILVSGNGRCNLTNAHVSAADYRGTPRLAEAVLQQFPFQKCLDFFHDLGVLTVEEENGRIFPRTGKSTAVAEALRLACEEAGVEIHTQSHVVKVEKKNHFRVRLESGESFSCKYCVLACGSAAYPQAGGCEDGYRLARLLGHHITPLTPALCALNVKEKAVARLQGIRAQVRLHVWPGTKQEIQSEAELLFTAYGLSGPAVLNISGPVGRALEKDPVPLAVDLLPEIENKSAFLKQRAARFADRRAKEFFTGLLHENIANLLIDFAGIRKNMPVKTWTENTWTSVARTLGAWPFTALSLRPWTEAMVAAGGVNCAEINYNTLESLCCPGLYILGELLDVDGRSGGFNLHFAWGCGFAAALAMPED